MSLKIVANASEILTPDDLIRDGAVVFDERIIEVGKSSLIERYDGAEVIDARGKTVIPGFIDSHTHLVFAGSREKELSMKLEGRSYLEIAKAGYGMGSTIRATREASKEEINSQSILRLNEMVRHGTTTAEAKNGYGLDLENELKLLWTIEDLNKRGPIDVLPTFLAHAIPNGKDRGEYVNEVVDMLPKVRGRAKFVDVFCEEGFFSIDESRRILERARELGFGLKMHADEFNDLGGAELAAELGCISADHLIRSGDSGLRALVGGGVVPCLLPANSFSSFDLYADARKMISMGLPVALASDLNPNCYLTNMQFVIQLACYHMRMTPQEAIRGATLNGARALGIEEEVGSLEKGKKADMLILDCKSHLDLAYRFGVNLVSTVIKGGETISDRKDR